MRTSAWLRNGPADGHRMVVGGLTVLERRVRELAARGVRRVTVLAPPEPLPAIAKIEVTFAPGAVVPDGEVCERGDELDGIVVEDDASRRRAEWAVLHRMNKSFEGPVDALVNSKVSMRITRLLARTRLTPNHVTLFAFLLGLVACELVRRGTYWPVAIGGVIIELNSILDSCDGELARLRYQFSKFGQWLDNVSDDVVDNVFIVCAGLGAGGPWAWLGIAAALSRAMVAASTYCMLHRAGDARRARSWADAAARDRRACAFQGRDEEIDPSSYLLGRGGVLVARATTASDARRAATAYAGHLRRASRRRAELVEGIAGLVVGASSILRRVEHPGVRGAGGSLNAVLVRRLQRAGRDAHQAIGFAHGWGGVLFALLAWSRATQTDVPAIAIEAMRAQLRAWHPNAVDAVMRASWCAGAAGTALLWAHAYERTGERAFLIAARRAARAAQAAIDPARRHLCCGAGGVAYALLALHRVDPDGGWRARAREVGARAIRSTTPLRHPNGLLWGHPGLVCLALDLVSEAPEGFPAIEA